MTVMEPTDDKHEGKCEEHNGKKKQYAVIVVFAGSVLLLFVANVHKITSEIHWVCQKWHWVMPHIFFV